jgi:uncharacterized membrane protein YdjX (TVP38/TMEM64 family)
MDAPRPRNGRPLALPVGLGFACLGILLAAGLPVLVLNDSLWQVVTGTLRTGFEGLQQAPPLLFFGVMAIACIFPIPISAFYIASGPLYGVLPALLWIAPALALNMGLSHHAASGYLRPYVSRLLARRGHAIPQWREPGDQNLLIVLIRITPGLPFFAQNLLLGLSDVDRRRNLLLSVPIQTTIAAGFVMLGESAFEGRLGMALGAVGIIATASIAARFVHRRLSPGPAASGADAAGSPNR